MSYVTILWSMIAAAALTLSLIHSIVWVLDRKALPNLAFALMSLGVVGIVWTELGMMHAQTPEEWGGWVRWYQPANFAVILAMLLFVRTYLGTGRSWLAWTIVALRAGILVVNFAVPPNFNFRHIDSIVRMRWLDEEISVIGDAVISPWQWIATVTTVLTVLFIVDATVSYWRRAPASARRKVVAGAAMTLFFVLSILYTQLVIWGVVRLPMLTAPPFLILLTVMGFELSRDTLRASRLARQLSESERQLELAAQAGGLGLWSWDAQSDRIWATDRARAMFEVSPRETILRGRLIAVIHADDLPRVRTALEQVTASSREQEVNFRIHVADGSSRWLLARGRSEFDTRDRLTLVRGVLRDVTSQQRTQEEMDGLRRDLAHAGRVTMLGQLSSAFAHELLQPLSAIMHNAEVAETLLRRPSLDLEELRQIVADILSDDRRATQLIERMRALLKRRQMERHSMPVDSLIQDVTAMVRGDASARGVTLETLLEPRLPMISGDKVHLSQVLINLIINAMDAVAGLPQERRKVVVRAQRAEKGYIEIAVVDRGTGVTVDAMDNMFQPFYTTKPNGMGMGLAMSRTIIEAHGGWLAVRNNAGHGATFHFALPAFENEPDFSEGDDPPAPMRVTSKQ